MCVVCFAYPNHLLNEVKEAFIGFDSMPINRLDRSSFHYTSLLFVIYYHAVAWKITSSAVFNLELGTSGFLELLVAGDLGPGPL